MESELYKKYRPKTFDDMFGNRAVLSTIKSAIKNHQLPHTILLSGPSGCGKCVTGDTLIYQDGVLKRIDECSQNKMGFVEQNSLIGNCKTFGASFSSHFYQEEVNKTIKIKTSIGNTIQGTQKHPILVLNEYCQYVFKKLKDIQIGDYVCISIGMNIFSCTKNEEPIIQHKKQNNCKNHFNIKRMDEDMASILGYMIANGCKNTNGMAFSSTKNILVKDLKNKLKKFGLDLIPHTGSINKDWNINSSEFKQVMQKLCNDFPTARFKEVPKIVLKSSKECQIAFIKALFDCDAYYGKNNVIEFCTASYKLANVVQNMLLNLGIVSTIRGKYVKKYDWTYWTLHIDSSSNDLYFSIIGSLNFIKKEIRHNPNKDIVPYVREFLKYIFDTDRSGRYVDYDGEKYVSDICINNNKNNLSYDKLEEIYKKLFNGKKTFKNQEAFNICAKLLHDHFYYAKITEKESVNKQVIVYDFTIPETHSFYSNGIISHNTTIARILKNELDCADGDFEEYNCSDRNGVDFGREIIARMRFKPMNGKCRIWLLDECHQMSAACANVLLKPLEDTPSYVYFILSTSEPDKLLAALKTRATHYAVSKLGESDLRGLLGTVSDLEHIKLSSEACDQIIENCNGSARMALVLLDQVKNLEEKEISRVIKNIVEQESQTIELCRALCYGKGWREVSTILNNLKEDPEKIRRAVLGYASKVLISPNVRNPSQIFLVIQCFENSFFNSGFAGLVGACYDVVTDGGRK